MVSRLMPFMILHLLNIQTTLNILNFKNSPFKITELNEREAHPIQVVLDLNVSSYNFLTSVSTFQRLI